MKYDEQWDGFLKQVAKARERLADGWVPVAMICLQASSAPDGAIDTYPWNDGAIIWLSEFPVAERGPLLARLAKPYDDKTVLRS